MTETPWCFTVVRKLSSKETLLQCPLAAWCITVGEKSHCPQLFFLLEMSSSHLCSWFQALVQMDQISTNCSFSPFAPARCIQATGAGVCCTPRSSSNHGSGGADPSSREQEQPSGSSNLFHQHSWIQRKTLSPDPRWVPPLTRLCHRDQNIFTDKKDEDALPPQHMCFAQLCGHTDKKVKRL